jgi:hypothetical protein
MIDLSFEYHCGICTGAQSQSLFPRLIDEAGKWLVMVNFTGLSLELVQDEAVSSCETSDPVCMVDSSCRKYTIHAP